MKYKLQLLWASIWILLESVLSINAVLREEGIHALPGKFNYQEATSRCKDEGMNMVKIQDDTSNRMVFNFAVRNRLGWYWIDGNDIQTEGNWLHNDGSRVSYIVWEKGQPDNAGNKENCLNGLLNANAATFNDLPCDAKISVICYDDRPVNIVTFENSQLVVLPDKANYQEAIDRCKSQGLQMVRIQNDAINQMVFNFAINWRLGWYWIDGTDQQREGHWLYNDGKRVTYLKWNEGQPDNAGNKENCLNGLLNANVATFNDLPCDLKISVICYDDRPVNIVTFAENQLVVLPDKANYQEATDRCKSEGMDMLKIQNDAINQMVFNFAVARKLGWYWIDGTDKQKEGQWLYNDGRRVTYLKWNQGQPDNAGNNENCLNGLLNPSAPTFNDLPCDTKISVICYRNTVVPEKEVEAKFDSLTIYLTDEEGSYEDAVNFCKNEKLKLIRVDNVEINKEIHKMFAKKRIKSFWIDGNDSKEERKWLDSEGNLLKYKNFKNNGGHDHVGNNHCIKGSIVQQGFWEHADCSSKHTTICYEEKS